jgi:hypothetical protein
MFLMSYPPPQQKINAPKGYTATQIPTMSPEAQQLYNKLINSVQGGAEKGTDYLSKLASGDESIFKQIEAPSYAAFDRLLDQTGSRFSQFGARDSSAFQNAVAGQGAELAQTLGAQRNDLQTNAIMKLLGLSENLLGKNPNETVLNPNQKDTSGQDWMKLFGEVAPELLKFFL